MNRSDAARLLPEKLTEKGWSQADLTRHMSDELGHVAEGLVNRWIKGTRKPNGAQVGWMQRVLGLNAELWAAFSEETSRARRNRGGQREGARH